MNWFLARPLNNSRIVASLFIFLALSFSAVYNFPKMLAMKNLGQLRKKSYIKFSERGMIEDSCVAMFDIGFGRQKEQLILNYKDIIPRNEKRVSERSWDSLIKAKEQATQIEEDYLPFVKSLPALVTTGVDGKLEIQSSTRLKIMNGKLPFVPCPIRDYTNEDLMRCIKIRQSLGKPLRIDLLGDSKARNLFHFVMDRTKHRFEWIIRRQNETTFRSRKNYTMTHLSTSLIAITDGIQLRFVPATHGTYFRSFEPVIYLRQLMRAALIGDPIPQILIIDFGIWEFRDSRSHLLDGHDNVMKSWKDLMHILSRLSKHVTIFALYQTRIRKTALDNFRKESGYFSFLFKKTLFNENLYLFNNTMRTAVDFIDNVMVEMTRDSDVIVWDSTLPFNLAGIMECEYLVKHNHSIIEEELKESRNHNLNNFNRFNCHDRLHKTKPTLLDETTMLFNIACNSYIDKNGKYCCSGTYL